MQECLPRKAGFVLDAIRSKDVETAIGILTYNPRYASSVILKLLNSAIANAENNNGMNADNLYRRVLCKIKHPQWNESGQEHKEELIEF